MVEKKFQIHGVKTTEKYIELSQKIEFILYFKFIFTDARKQNFPPGSYHHYSR